MVYTRPAHGDPFADSSATDATVIIDALADGLEAVESGKAALASPTFTGTPAAPTASAGTNTTQVATTAFVNTNTVRVTHPNTDDVLVEVYDKVSARWQTTHYDSGWRDVSASLINGWTGGLLMRRVNQTVEIRPMYTTPLNAGAKSNVIFFTPPTGFRQPATGGIYGAGAAYPVVGTFYVGVTTAISVRSDGGGASVNMTTTDTTINGGYAKWPLRASEGIPASLPGTTAEAAPA